jgi:hypothetical protein
MLVFEKVHTYIHTLPLTLDPRRDSKDISDVPPRRTKLYTMYVFCLKKYMTVLSIILYKCLLLTVVVKVSRIYIFYLFYYDIKLKAVKC